jgi:CheY-like chemotaxis protein
MKAPSRPPSEHMATSGSVPVDVLLVEDNLGDVMLIRQTIAERGLPVKLTTAMDGEQALRILGSGFSPALIILDLNLPKVSGLTLLERYQRAAPPVVVFSSSCNVDELSRAIALGARDCIRKPMDIAAYFQAVQCLIEKWALNPTGTAEC